MIILGVFISASEGSLDHHEPQFVFMMHYQTLGHAREPLEESHLGCWPINGLVALNSLLRAEHDMGHHGAKYGQTRLHSPYCKLNNTSQPFSEDET